MYKNILVALDPESESNVPLITGMRLAAEYDAGLRVVCVVRTSLLKAKGFFNVELVEKSELMAEARAALRSRLAAVRAEGVPTDLLIGDPGETIANAAQQRGSDLVVIGARRRRLSETLFGTTATTVLREARSADVYACHRLDPDTTAERVLVAIDGSKLTPQVLKETHLLIGSSLTGTRPEVRIACVVDDSKRHAERMASAQNYVAASDLAAIPVEGVHGAVVPRLVTLTAEFDADLIIVGSGRNFGVSWYIGSTANDLLHDADCDVLVIRSD